MFKKHVQKKKVQKKTNHNCRTIITATQFRNPVITAKTDTCRGGKYGQFKILNVLIVFVTFKTTYLVFYTSVFLTLARFSTYITNEVLWCSKNLYFKKLFYLRKTNSLYLEKLLLLLISNASSRMQSSSPHAGLVVFTAPKPRPRPAATASLPHGISLDETDSCRTLPKWNLCNQAFLCCSICFFSLFFFPT